MDEKTEDHKCEYRDQLEGLKAILDNVDADTLSFILHIGQLIRIVRPDRTTNIGILRKLNCDIRSIQLIVETIDKIYETGERYKELITIVIPFPRLSECQLIESREMVAKEAIEPQPITPLV